MKQMATDSNELMQQNTSKFSFNQISDSSSDDSTLTVKIRIEPVANSIHVPIQIDCDCVDSLSPVSIVKERKKK